MSTPEAGLVVALLVQFAGLVWGASRISSAVNSLNATVLDLKSAVRHLDVRLQDHEVRVSVLEKVTTISPHRRVDEP